MAKKEKQILTEPIVFLWKDRIRHFGLPLSFTRYRLSEDRLFLERGFFSIKVDEVLLYRVRDLNLSMTLWQRIFGVGTIIITSTDKSIPKLYLKNIKNPREVKELIHQTVEKKKDEKRMRPMELMGGNEFGGNDDFDNDGDNEDDGDNDN